MDLNKFSGSLSEEGFDVVDKIAEENSDGEAMGAVVIETTIKIEGEEFEGEVTYKVFNDRIEPKGVDIWQSTAGVEENSNRESLLNRVSAIRDEDPQGAIWTYYQQEEVSDNLGEIYDEVNSVFQGLE